MRILNLDATKGKSLIWKENSIELCLEYQTSFLISINFLCRDDITEIQ